MHSSPQLGGMKRSPSLRLSESTGLKTLLKRAASPLLKPAADVSSDLKNAVPKAKDADAVCGVRLASDRLKVSRLRSTPRGAATPGRGAYSKPSLPAPSRPLAAVDRESWPFAMVRAGA